MMYDVSSFLPVSVTAVQRRMCFRPKSRKVLLTGTGARASMPASHDVPNGVPLMPSFTAAVASEASAKQTGDVIRLDDDDSCHLPR